MKKWFERVFTSVSLIGGYGLMAVIYLMAAAGIGYVSAELFVRTQLNPSPWIIAADIFVVLLVVSVLTRKQVRKGFSELWSQIFKNM